MRSSFDHLFTPVISHGDYRLGPKIGCTNRQKPHLAQSLGLAPCRSFELTGSIRREHLRQNRNVFQAMVQQWFPGQLDLYQ